MANEENTYKYTQDWFHWAPEIWGQLKGRMKSHKKFLEIGSFEGRSTVWTAENMAADGANIWCVDTWEGGEEHGPLDMDASEALFDHNMSILEKRTLVTVHKCKGTSVRHLADLAAGHEQEFDFVYIDGSHIAKDVLTDACMSWPLLKEGGLMVFDDYLWGSKRDVLHRPKVAVDAFSTLFAEELDIVHIGYQYVLQKRTTEGEGE